MSYINPLHEPVSAFNQSQFSAIGGANEGVPEEPQFISSFRRRLPYLPYAPASKWHNTTGRSSPLQDPIRFDFIGYQRQGVPMLEMSTKGAHTLEEMVEGARDEVLAHSGLDKITLRILWPGYEHMEWSRVIQLNAHGPTTRAQLGAAVSMNYSRFMEKARGEHVTSPDYAISYNKIRFEHVILLSLCNVFEDVWQADVAIELR